MLRKNRQIIAKTLENEVQLLQQLQARLDTQAQQRQSAEQARQSAEESLQAYRKAIADLESQRNHNQDQRSRFDAERARTAAQLEVLEQAERSLSGLANGAKFLLQEVRQGRLKGRLSTVEQSACCSG